MWLLVVNFIESHTEKEVSGAKRNEKKCSLRREGPQRNLMLEPRLVLKEMKNDGIKAEVPLG